MPEQSRLWEIVVKIAVDVAEEAQARSIVDMLIGKMQISTLRPPEFVRFEDGM